MNSAVTTPQSAWGSSRPCTRRIGGASGLRWASEAPRSTLASNSASRSIMTGLLDRRGRAQPQHLADLGLEIGEHDRIFLKPALGVLAALADPLVLVRVPGAGFLDDRLLHARVEDGARLRDALAVDHVELR